MCTLLAGIAALTGLMQYRAQKQNAAAQADYYRAVADQNKINAKIAEQQRSQLADNYAKQQKQLDDRRRILTAENNASAGASGLNGTGSVLDANASAYDEWKESSMNLLWNQRVATHDAWVQQANYMNQASANMAAASNVKKQARLAGLATLIGTAASVYSGVKDFSSSRTNTESTGEAQYRTGYTGDLQSGTLSYGSPTAMYGSERTNLFPKLNTGMNSFRATPAAYSTTFAPKRFKGITGWRK